MILNLIFLLEFQSTFFLSAVSLSFLSLYVFMCVTFYGEANLDV